MIWNSLLFTGSIEYDYLSVVLFILHFLNNQIFVLQMCICVECSVQSRHSLLFSEC